MATQRNNNLTLDTPRVALLLCALVLTLIGFVMVYSAGVGEAWSSTKSTDSTSFLLKHIMFAGVGIFAGVIVWVIAKPDFLRKRSSVIFIVVLTWALLLATSFYGIATNGAQRWIQIGNLGTIQPSEFVKIALVVLGCKLLSDYQEGSTTFGWFIGQVFLLLIAPLAFMFVAQSDLGSALIIGIGLLTVLWIGNVPAKWVAGILAVACIFVILSIAFTPYRSDRMYYLNPFADGEGGAGKGFQLVRSFYAFSQGGIIGAGIGNSTEKLTPLPEAETDFIFAIIGEETGLFGSVLLLVIFLGFLIAGFRVASSTEDPLAAMLAGSLASMLVFQAFLNMACVSGLAPTTGKPLPFITSGGSSMIASFMIVGLIMTAQPAGSGSSIYDKRRENLRVVRAEKVVKPRVARFSDRVKPSVAQPSRVKSSRVKSSIGKSSSSLQADRMNFSGSQSSRIQRHTLTNRYRNTNQATRKRI